MDTSPAHDTHIPVATQPIGRVIAVSGAQVSVDLTGRPPSGEIPTVGKFMGLTTLKSVIIALITDVGEQPIAAAGGGPSYRQVAQLDLIGEILTATAGGAR